MATCEAHCLSLAATSSSLSLRANITPSTKPDIRNVSLRRPRRTEEDRATATGNVHKKFGEDRTCRYDRGQTHTYTQRQTDTLITILRCPIVGGATISSLTRTCRVATYGSGRFSCPLLLVARWSNRRSKSCGSPSPSTCPPRAHAPHENNHGGHLPPPIYGSGLGLRMLPGPQ